MKTSKICCIRRQIFHKSTTRLLKKLFLLLLERRCYRWRECGDVLAGPASSSASIVELPAAVTVSSLSEQFIRRQTLLGFHELCLHGPHTHKRTDLEMLIYLHSSCCQRHARTHARTHTHTHPFNGPLPGTTRVSRYQKGKTNLDFTEARDSEWQWHQLGHMRVCTSLQTDNHASAPHHSSFLQAGCTSCRPTNSVKALKAKKH